MFIVPVKSFILLWFAEENFIRDQAKKLEEMENLSQFISSEHLKCEGSDMIFTLDKYSNLRCIGLMIDVLDCSQEYVTYLYTTGRTYPRKTHDHGQITERLFHIQLERKPGISWTSVVLCCAWVLSNKFCIIVNFCYSNCMCLQVWLNGLVSLFSNQIKYQNQRFFVRYDLWT